MSIRTLAITREAIEESPDVILTAAKRLAVAKPSFATPGPVTLVPCPGHPDEVETFGSKYKEKCLIHLSQEFR